MPAADAVLSAIGASLLLAHFVVSRRRSKLKLIHGAST